MNIPQSLKKTLVYRNLRDIYISYKKGRALNCLLDERREVMKNYEEKFYLNIGAGKFIKNDWRIMDYGDYSSDVIFPKELIDFNVNLIPCEKWPIPDNSVDLVYSSHCLEHIGRTPAQHVFFEVYRILKSGSIFRVTLPDMDLLYKKYMERDFQYFKSFNKNLIDENLETLFLRTLSPLRDTSNVRKDSEIMAKEDFLNKYTPPVDFTDHDFSVHVTWFNHDILKKMSRVAGFSEYKISSFRQSVSEEMRSEQFDTVSEKMSLYTDIIK